MRNRLVQRRTSLINEIRGLLLARDIAFAAKPFHLRDEGQVPEMPSRG